MNDLPEISVAPMMDWTDRHCRYFHRLISPNARLYTEMVTTGALIHGDTERFLCFDEAEHPVALQLGGSDPEDLARCAEMGAREGYDEINLNCGCPSDRVQKGKIGAILMEEPDLVADCAAAMIAAVDVPVTIKCRIGIDEQDGFDFLDRFVDRSADKGVKTFIIHARKAWLSGLSPKQNREVPELNYKRAAEIKAKYPELRIILNGGIIDIQSIQGHLKVFDGVMIGREAYSNPYFLAEIERDIFGNDALLSREDISQNMIQYIKKQSENFETPVKSISRHMLGLFHHQKGARAWKRHISENAFKPDADYRVIEEALNAAQESAGRST